MPLRGDLYEVLGVGVRGPEPVGRAYVELNPGVIALYGLNGSGKTRLLAGIEAALTGSQTGATLGDVWLRVLEPEQHLADDSRRHPLVLALAEGATEQVRASWHNGREFDEFEERDRLAAVGAERLIEEHPSVAEIVRRALSDFLDLGGEGTEEYADATAQIAFEGLLHLRALESTAPGWLVRPAGDVGWMVEGGFVTQFVHDADTFWRGLNGEIGLEEYRPRFWIFLAGANIAGHSLVADRWTLVQRSVARLNVMRPPWAAVELGPAGRLTAPPVNVVRLGDAATDVDEETLRAASETTNSPLIASDGEATIIDQALTDFLAAVSVRASQLYATFLAGASELRCELAHPNEWFRGRVLRWRATDAWRSTPLPLAALSAAQRKWADVSIRLALIEDSFTPTVLLLDEPEGSLHRAAEQHLVDGLVRLAAEGQIAVLVATHSPLFLGHAAVAKLHVSRAADGQATVAALPTELGQDQPGIVSICAALGIGAGDLLQMVRCFLVVEGQHDFEVFHGLFGQELSEGMVRIAPLRGAKNLGSAINAQLLFDFTDAPV